VVGGAVVLDTLEAFLLMETGILPVAYGPLADIDQALLERTSTETFCPFKGTASYWSVNGVDDALWAYENPISDAPWLSGMAALDRFKIDHYLVEEDRVFGPHLRDPYTRVDVHESSRAAVVAVAGVVVARTARPKLLFETGLPVRVYIPPADVVAGVLEPSPKREQCPYKGESTYRHVRAGDTLVEDVCWSYETPLPDASRAQGHVAFHDERDDVTVETQPALTDAGATPQPRHQAHGASDAQAAPTSSPVGPAR